MNLSDRPSFAEMAERLAVEAPHAEVLEVSVVIDRGRGKERLMIWPNGSIYREEVGDEHELRQPGPGAQQAGRRC